MLVPLCTSRTSDRYPRLACVKASHGNLAHRWDIPPFLPHVFPGLAWKHPPPSPLLSYVWFSISCCSPMCIQGDPALQEVRKIAAEITVRCLRRWDSFLAIRAGKDSLGRQAGIWKDKFESVRSAALLLAFRMVNTQLQRQALRASPGGPDPPGTPLIRRKHSGPFPPLPDTSRQPSLSCSLILPPPHGNPSCTPPGHPFVPPSCQSPSPWIPFASPTGHLAVPNRNT